MFKTMYHLKGIYEELVTKLHKSRNVTLEEIEYLCHVTSEENLKKIQRSGHLRGSKLECCEQIEGVWTIASKDKDGNLHSQSPYGTKRLKFKIGDICEDPDEWSLFFERTYPIGGGVTPTNQYIRLVLIRGRSHQREFDWCINNLYELTLHDNPFFKLAEDRDIGELAANLFGVSLRVPTPYRPSDIASSIFSRLTPEVVTYSYHSIKCKTTRLCVACQKHVTECEGRCKCQTCGEEVEYCRQKGKKCDPTRKKTKLKLYVEVFVVGSIEESKKVDVVDVIDTSKGLKTGIPAPKVPEDHRFFM